jgi:hypothetical protein
MMRGGTDGLCGHGAPGTVDAWDNRATMRENGAADNGKFMPGTAIALKNARPRRRRRTCSVGRNSKSVADGSSIGGICYAALFRPTSYLNILGNCDPTRRSLKDGIRRFHSPRRFGL